MKQQTAVEWLKGVIDSFGNKHELQMSWSTLDEIIEQAKEMEKEQIMDASKINRVEVIQHSEPFNGRAYTNYGAKDVEIQFQDNGRTLKIFLK